EAEARRLVALGVQEITLLGQNVNAYHGQGPDGRPWSLAGLMARLALIDGLERQGSTTSHPRHKNGELSAFQAHQTKLAACRDGLSQRGSSRCLAPMTPMHSRADYLPLVDRIRVARPDIALSTDVIVGFPGETAAEFEHTLQVMERVRFAQAYSFKYSARP